MGLVKTRKLAAMQTQDGAADAILQLADNAKELDQC